MSPPVPGGRLVSIAVAVLAVLAGLVVGGSPAQACTARSSTQCASGTGAFVGIRVRYKTGNSYYGVDWLRDNTCDGRYVSHKGYIYGVSGAGGGVLSCFRTITYDDRHPNGILGTITSF